MGPTYVLSALQSEIHVIRNLSEKEGVVKKNLDRALELAAHTVATEGSRLLVFAEGWLQGFLTSRALDEWLKICLKVPGPETDRLGEFCRRSGVYLAGAVFEKDDSWPRRFFNTAIVVGPSGKIELKYRQLNPETLNGLMPVTSPADLFDEYVGREGKEVLFPVADTNAGRLSCIVGNDINFPEHSRSLVLRGAEILLHLTGETTAAAHPAWEDVRRSRAYENVAYLVSVSNGGLVAGLGPRLRARGHSEIISYEGKPLASADSGGEIAIHAAVSLSRLRYRRTQVRMNFPAQSKIKMYGATYHKAARMPNNLWASHPIQSAEEGLQQVRKIIEGH